jgi:subtilisin family serine protease
MPRNNVAANIIGYATVRSRRTRPNSATDGYETLGSGNVQEIGGATRGRVRQFMRTIWVLIAAVMFLMGGIAGAAEPDSLSGAFYYYGDEPTELVVVLEELSVGTSTGQELFNRSALQFDALAVQVQPSPLGAATWRVRLDPQTLLKSTANIQAGVFLQRAAAPDQAKTVRPDARVERQRRVIDALLADGSVDWAYPAYRNPETGTLLWLTPRLIVGVSPSLAESSIEEYLPADIRLVRPLAQANQFLVELIDPRLDEPLQAAARLKDENWWVEWAEPDFIQDWRRPISPNDPLFSDQWHLENTGQGGGVSGADARLSGAWDLETGNSSVVIAVIDDGVQTGHPDLPIYANPGEIPANMVDDDGNGYVDDVNGWDFFYGDNDPNPDLTGPGSHGTAVAGVAAATGNNAVGVSGACQDCSILPARVFNDTSAASDSAFADAITYAGEMADVLNNSWGGGSPVMSITTAIQNAVASGRGGLGSPAFFSTANSATGYFKFKLTGFPAGTFTLTWDYIKDVSLSKGFDTAWIDNVTFPDGTTEDFETCTSLPSGWTTSGDASWQAVSDGTRASSAWGGHCSIGAGSITDNQSTSMSVTKTFAVGGDLSFYVWPSSETTNPGGEGPITTSCYDYLGMTINGTPQSVSLCGTYSNQGTPLQDGIVAYPADIGDSIAVGAATNFDRRSDYSQWGPEIDFVCHSNGGSLGITTTDITGGNGYSTSDYTSGFGGTSSAAPLCSGIAALAISADSTLTAAELRQKMRDSGRKIGSVAYTDGWNSRYGFGAVDAAAVVSSVSPGGGIIVEKQTIPDGDQATFTFTGDAAGAIGDDQQIVVASGGGTYFSTETAPDGWSLLAIDCDDSDSTVNIGAATATFNVSSEETVTCVFTNCDDSYSTVDLSGMSVTGTEVFAACDTLTADNFEVGSTGKATFRAGSTIVLENGFSVASGGAYTAEIIGLP